MEEMFTGYETGMNVATDIKGKLALMHQRCVLVRLGKDVGTERMHCGFLSDQQQLNCAPFLQMLLRTWRQN